MAFPVSGSWPAVYRPSQRPSFLLRRLPSPLARFFAMVSHSFRSDTTYHTSEGISSWNRKSYQFRHIFFQRWRIPSLCIHWCNPWPALADKQRPSYCFLSLNFLRGAICWQIKNSAHSDRALAEWNIHVLARQIRGFWLSSPSWPPLKAANHGRLRDTRPQT